MTGPTCPKGHAVGTKWDERTCTKLTCAEQPAQLKPGYVPKTKKKYDPPPEVAERSKPPTEALTPAHALFVERVTMAGVPAGLSADEALAWSQRKLQELLPEAVAELQFQLRYGNDKQRFEAVDRVLNANGVAKKEVANGPTGPTVIVNLGGDLAKVPFLARAVASAKKDQ